VFSFKILVPQKVFGKSFLKLKYNEFFEDFFWKKNDDSNSLIVFRGILII